MTLFTVGPVEMYPRTLELRSKQIPYFRVPEFSRVVIENERLLQEMAHAEAGSRTVFLTASGTGAMEATVMNCLTPHDKVLIIDGGSFGHRFVDICAVHGIPHETLKVPFGQELAESDLAPYEAADFTALLVNIHETSIGHLYDGQMLARFCRRNDLLFVVDAISSFLADQLDMAGLTVDALIGSSQKALALAPGMSFVILSPRMLEERIRPAKRMSVYFDFNDHLGNGERGQTPFTPAVGILLEMNDRLRMIEDQGVENAIAQTSRVAVDFRERIGGLPLSVPGYRLSNAVTPLLFPAGGAQKVFDDLRFHHDAVLTPSGGELADRMLRVGHLGSHSTADNISLVEALWETTADVGVAGGARSGADASLRECTSASEIRQDGTS